jgi:hypothetical protein
MEPSKQDLGQTPQAHAEEKKRRFRLVKLEERRFRMDKLEERIAPTLAGGATSRHPTCACSVSGIYTHIPAGCH